ncbi:MAG: UTRA domain-containing protein [Rhizobiales bacterium]|nr:UTRA domain-containing protein [Hyphomicrobiales bacterium]
MSEAPYRRIMNALRSEIASGRLAPGDRIPSENELAQSFSVSRMTANRAVRELAAEGLVFRTAGSGSFVAEQRLELSLLRVPDIIEEIRSAGGHYSARLIARNRSPARGEIASAFEVPAGWELLHTLIVHESDGRPIQLEDRYVDPAFAPDYLDQIFEARSPNAYLTAIARPEQAEQIVEAVAADSQIARLLNVSRGHACLKVKRRTWCGGRIATLAWLTAPGERWRLNVKFSL